MFYDVQKWKSTVWTRRVATKRRFPTIKYAPLRRSNASLGGYSRGKTEREEKRNLTFLGGGCILGSGHKTDPTSPKVYPEKFVRMAFGARWKADGRSSSPGQATIAGPVSSEVESRWKRCGPGEQKTVRQSAAQFTIHFRLTPQNKRQGPLYYKTLLPQGFFRVKLGLDVLIIE